MNFSDLQIETNGKAKGKTYCPKCHQDRKNKKDKSLSFDTIQGVYYCHHCEWKGTTKEAIETVSWTDFFQNRGISPYTLRKLSVREHNNTIQFPYFQDGEQVNTKSRPLAEKKFWAEKGGKSIPYNIDSVNGNKEVIITEGEMDVLSYVEAGYLSVISPPFGANENIKWIPDRLKQLERIYISVDKDEKGIILQKSLVEYFGESKCHIIDVGEYKDVNELLNAKGVKAVHEVFKKASKKSNDKLDEIADKFIVDPYAKVEKPRTAINANSEIFGTLGNISLVTGKGKSRKTFLITALAAAALGGDTLETFYSDNKGGNVVYFDTEQGEYHATMTANRIVRMIDQDNIKYLKFFRLREISTTERLDFIDYILSTFDTRINAVIIDGVRDLVFDINSTDEATRMSDHLLKWSSKYECHIINVLHQNKADNNARGHLGSELVNKSETVVSVEKWDKDDNISVMKPEFTRNTELSSIMFQVNDEGLPVKYNEDIKATVHNKKIMPNIFVDADHWKIIEAIFKIKQEFNKTDIRDRTKYALNDFDHKIGAHRANDFIQYWLDNQYVKNIGTGNNHKYIMCEKIQDAEF